jgi:hypothetical protein
VPWAQLALNDSESQVVRKKKNPSMKKSSLEFKEEFASVLLCHRKYEGLAGRAERHKYAKAVTQAA